MTSERWLRIKELFSLALEIAPDKRKVFLEKECVENDSIRAEVERLLTSYEEDQSFMENPAVKEVASEIHKKGQYNHQAGEQISHYKIIKGIGAGGMGEVYLAEDTKLNRNVALKLLPDQFTKDEERLRRFKREASAASALNHPNILTIHEVGEAEGLYFIATEYVEGETLRERMVIERIKINEVLEFSIQIASALTAAHAAGVVHRDIKPENIMLRRDHLVKVLDFGLAKLTRQNSVKTDAANALSNHSVNTAAGMIMGTTPYMSPEQAQGDALVDQRTDIWSLGVVLYEMVTGRSVFDAKDAPRQIIAIQESEPPQMSIYVEGVPERLEEIVQKALAKDPDERYQTARDLLIDLRFLKKRLEIDSEIERSIPPEFRGSGARHLISYASHGHSLEYEGSKIRRFVKTIKGNQKYSIALFAAIFIAVLYPALLLYKSYRQDRSKLTADSARTIPFTSFPGQKSGPAFSPDGNQIAFAWDGGGDHDPGIFVKLIDAGPPLRLTSLPDSDPVWSPDGRHIAFVRRGAESGIFMVPALGGPERKLTDMAGIFTWSPDGKYLAISAKDLQKKSLDIYLFSIETGEKRRITDSEPGSLGDAFPSFSPDGQLIAFIRTTHSEVSDIYLISANGDDIKRLTYDNLYLRSNLAWTTDGQEIVFSSDRGGLYSLWRINLSGGSPKRLLGIGEYAISPSISRYGNRLTYVYRKKDANIWRAAGPKSNAKDNPPVKLIASTRNEDSPQFSPDGKRIVFASDRSGSYEIWVSGSDGQNLIQLTNFGGAHTGTPRWSPDGANIAFDSRPNGHSNIYVINVGGGSPKRVTDGAYEDVLPSWSRDGRWIYFGSRRSGNWEIWKVPVQGAGGEPVQVTKNGGFEGFESSDGKYFYYVKYKEFGVWKTLTDAGVGGEESKVFEKGYMGYWSLLEDGICFLNREAMPQPTVEYFDFATGKISQLNKIEKSKAPGGSPGFAVSSNGQWILYWQVDQLDSDIMLVENFH